MKVAMPTANEIYTIADRAECAVYVSQSRSASKLVIENAIRQALAIVAERSEASDEMLAIPSRVRCP